MLFVQKAAIGGKDGDKAAKNAAEAFRLLRTILLQDLPLYFKDFPELPVFKSRVFKDRWSAFVRWSELLQKYSQECDALGAADRGLNMFGDGGSTIFGHMPIVAQDVPAPTGFKKFPIEGSDFLCYLEKVMR